jgi:serine/threonine-protein kinase
MNRCPTCGTSYADDARFCTRDGSKLVAMPERAGDGPGSPFAAAMRTPLEESTAVRSEPAAEPAHGNLAGQVLDGRYRIVRKVGEGGMSVVYLATGLEAPAAADVPPEERYAIKVLSASLSRDGNAMARLRREASMGMRLAHPNVCHIIRLGETPDGLVYVVMPFLEGEVLSDRSNRLGTIPIPDVLSFVADIAAGLQRAHDLGIVHRDLKPENVMVCPRPDGTERAVVMDFGLAKERRADAELQKLTATGIILGTPEFMSPEQLRGRPLDGRTDVYALALITFEMLSGKLPFTGRTQQEMMIARLRSEPVPLRQVVPEAGYPATLERVLDRAMKREPDDRYPNAPDFAAALASAAPREDGGMLGRLFAR